MKKIYLFVLGLLSLLSCNSKIPSSSSIVVLEENKDYFRELSIHSLLQLPEYTILKTNQEIDQLFHQLQNNLIHKYPRSFPISTIEEGKEALIVFKPKLKDPYALIEIEKIALNNHQLILEYSEKENWKKDEDVKNHLIEIIRINVVPNKIKTIKN